MSAAGSSMYSPAAVEIAEQLGLRMGRANLEEFADVLLSLAKSNRDILAVTSDSRGSGKLGPFAAALPQQIIELGIAEQNLVGVSAGLASAGKCVFAVSPACFLSARALEQIKNDIAYSDQPVKLIGISAGVSYGALGSTHHSLHDLAALRAIHNIDIVVPADNCEARQAIAVAAERTRPIYIRFGKAPLYHLPGSDEHLQIGSARLIREGSDLAFIATGETVIHALLAAQRLREREGISCRVISMHTIKPLDAPCVLQAARDCRALITVEEHSIHGGLGEACAAALMQSGGDAGKVRFKIVGIPDEETVTGSQADIFRHYGISMESLAEAAMKLLE
jgi:transketolase